MLCSNMDNALIEETLGNLFKEINLPYDGCDISEGNGFIRVELKSSKASHIIGWHGETLGSIQQLLKTIIRAKENLDRAPFIILDIDGYLKSKEEKVCRMAEQKADLVRRTGNRVALAPMNPYFRRVVHLHVADHKDMQDLTTESTGQGDYRQIVLKLKNAKAAPAQGEELSPVIAEEEDGLENLDI